MSEDWANEKRFMKILTFLKGNVLTIISQKTIWLITILYLAGVCLVFKTSQDDDFRGAFKFDFCPKLGIWINRRTPSPANLVLAQGFFLMSLCKWKKINETVDKVCNCQRQMTNYEGGSCREIKWKDGRSAAINPLPDNSRTPSQEGDAWKRKHNQWKIKERKHNQWKI